MKKYILMILISALFGACEIDLKPESELIYDGYWDTEEAARAAHVGIYGHFREYATSIYQMGELRSDMWGGKTIESPNNVDLINNNISPTVLPFNNWANYYKIIHFLNDFIKNAPTVTFANEAEKKHMMGQTYGIRAFVYYTMLKAWGDVPINTDPLVSIDLDKLKKPRSPKSEVMKLVKADIAKSLEYFNADNTLWKTKNIYWSKAATLALKGDVYLWAGKVLGGGNADFTEAKAALEQVTGFSLVNYTSLWGQNNENNKEFIFAFDYQQDQAENFYGLYTGRAVDFKNLFDEKALSVADLTVNGGSRFGPSDKTLLLLNDLQDLRSRTFTRLYSNKQERPQYIPNDAKYMGALLNKFLGIIGAEGLRKNHNNVPLYRYADVVLLLAEAKNNLGEDPTNEMTLIRRRAYGDNYTGHEFTNGTKAENKKAILNERYKEFIGEGKRWWDLVRAGDNIVFEEVTSLKASEAYKIYYPISPTMLANDPELKQTEGY